ncbi:ubiquitin carboxyl-terminal hydrolase 47-like [Parambassis ranga]|uniref:Ubiquitin carboxyl-terminal hydrolase 47-like n=1 Tax=Parambassis ranga TaxID=210632 RepID=A0A6P7K7C0_9TELE|nr:ubiquitin carboxyl-terminal hydrolase 47-like [Parambassis ranga]
MFEGQLSETTKCSKGHSINEEMNPFWMIPLSLRDNCDATYSVEKGFERVFNKKTFSGDNSVFCPDCETKMEATSGCTMETSPPILTLLLKRFDFDYTTMSHVKSDCCVEVPPTINTPQKKYELYAMVNHMGSISGGHYTATVLSREDRAWYECDDAHVTKAEEQPFTKTSTHRSRTAYLLMYRASESDRDNLKDTFEDQERRRDEAKETCNGSKSHINKLKDMLKSLKSRTNKVKNTVEDPDSHRDKMKDMVEDPDSHRDKMKDTLEDPKSHKDKVKHMVEDPDSHRDKMKDIVEDPESHRDEVEETVEDPERCRDEAKETSKVSKSPKHKFQDMFKFSKSHRMKVKDTVEDTDSHRDKVKDTIEDPERRKDEAKETQSKAPDSHSQERKDTVKDPDRRTDEVKEHRAGSNEHKGVGEDADKEIPESLNSSADNCRHAEELCVTSL